jgi:hypothetical protein
MTVADPSHSRLFIASTLQTFYRSSPESFGTEAVHCSGTTNIVPHSSLNARTHTADQSFLGEAWRLVNSALEAL